MKIKRLEIRGFKSFHDKTVFDFRPGITAVVGPNGSGKSNVLEAIRWVMGEQRVRSLRGKKMEDVIFNGSETRKPVGMAEVRLVLSTDDGIVPPSMAEYDEIMITRRLFRDGESQYEINNIPCRLSDVTDFFMDTGVGRNSYAIIEQGRVDMVVASKPEDRRLFIEEAAGITRYKSRKEVALKKLEQTKQNLLRIGDLISEVKRQSVSLKRQASKAERYRQLNARLRELDISLHAHKCNVTREEYHRVKAELDSSRSALIQRETGFDAVEAQLEQSRIAVLQTETQLKELLEARHKVDLELTSTRSRIDSDRQRVSELQDRQKRRSLETEALNKRIEQSSIKTQELKTRSSAVQADTDAATKELNEALGESQQSEQDLATHRQRLDQLKDAQFNILQETAQQRNRRETLAKRRTEIVNGLAKIERDSESIISRLKIDENEKSLVADEIVRVLQLRRECVQKKEELSATRDEASKSIGSLRKELAQTEKITAADQARLQSLEEMQRDYVVYGDGVRLLMKSREDQPKEYLLGPLAEAIEVSEEFQEALTAALGERLGHVVVTSTRDGIEAANQLKEADAGRTTLIPLFPRRLSEADDNHTPPGLLRLKDVVRFRNGFEELGDFLLDRCFLVENIEQAVEIWETNGIHVDLVTIRGEVLNRYGEITGGSQENGRKEVFEKRREIESLKTRVSELETSIAQIQSILNERESHFEKLTAELEETDHLISDLNLKEVRLKSDQERLETQLTATRRRVEVIGLERERLNKEESEIAIQLEQSDLAAASLEKTRLELETEKQEIQKATEQLELSLRDRFHRTEQIRVRLAQLEERGHSLERELRSSNESVTQYENQLCELLDEISLSEQDSKRLAEEIEASETKEKQLMMQHEEQGLQIEALKRSSAELSSRLRDFDEQSASLARSVSELRKSVHAQEMESVRLEQMLADLVEKILERHHVDPRNVPTPEIVPGEEEIAEMKTKLESLGEVNLAAITESRLTEERLTFLLEQEDDLNKAVDSLYLTINTINKTTTERFRAAFDSVNEQFQEIFPFLFRGGEGRLELTNEDDLLESGVEIMARPPGKRIQNMDLLSGGEKALTAEALIFSIFLTRPSPFCLLDEVDAPLDDANLARFHEMLRRLSDKTQFLFITHNKRSMQEADSLYGITMEEPGASSIVSVEFVN
ncbi:MAG: chromosome segregation protein SMC [Desulfomonilaceae bacterium]